MVKCCILHKMYSRLWKSKRFNEMCVLGGGEISGSRCDVASSWCLACLCFLQLMVYREFFMDTMQMVVAIPFVSFSVSLLLPAAAAWLGFLFCSTAESS